MSEEFALQKVFWNGTAVDSDHFLLTAWAVFVHGLGDEFLAGSAFTGDQNRSIRASDPSNELEDFLERSGNTDHLNSSIVLRHFRIRLTRTAAVVLNLQCRFDDWA